MLVKLSPEAFGTILGLLLERRNHFERYIGKTKGQATEFIRELINDIDRAIEEFQQEAEDITDDKQQTDVPSQEQLDEWLEEGAKERHAKQRNDIYKEWPFTE